MLFQLQNFYFNPIPIIYNFFDFIYISILNYNFIFDFNTTVLTGYPKFRSSRGDTYKNFKILGLGVKLNGFKRQFFSYRRDKIPTLFSRYKIFNFLILLPLGVKAHVL